MSPVPGSSAAQSCCAVQCQSTRDDPKQANHHSQGDVKQNQLKQSQQKARGGRESQKCKQGLSLAAGFQ